MGPQQHTLCEALHEYSAMNWLYRHSYRMYFESGGSYREVPWTDYYPADYRYFTLSVRLCVNI